MPLRRELMFAVGVLVVLNLMLAVGSVGLFVRMGPAIERVMEENSYSIEAAEEILAVLADSGGEPLSPAGRERVEQALERAKKNVTDPQEQPVLMAMEASLPGAMDADLRERRQLVSDTQRLILINRDAMYAVDREAQRLGRAGAWASVLVGVLSFTASLLVIARLRRRLVTPLEELDQVLQGVKRGDPHRRGRSHRGPLELNRVTAAVNAMLDERLPGGGRKQSRPPADLEASEE